LQAARFAVVVVVGAAREVVIDPTRLDCGHGENARGSQRRDKPKNGPRRQKPPGDPCRDRGKGVTGMVECLVSADPSREQRGADNS
jgi:hypothetical protein